MRIWTPLCVIALLAGCSSSSSKTLPASGGATSSGGQAGSAGSGGGTAGAAGAAGGSAGSGGSAGGSGGTAGSGGGPPALDLADCGFKTSDVEEPTLYSKLDSISDVNTPPKGPKGSEEGVVSYSAPGRCDGAALSVGTSPSAYVQWPVLSVLSFKFGTIAFWLKPNWDHDDKKGHNLFRTSSSGTSAGGMGVRKSLLGQLIVEFSQAGGDTYTKTIPKDQYTLNQGQWSHIVINWDAGLTDKISVYIGGTKVGPPGTGQFPTFNPKLSDFQLGSTGTSSATVSDAQFDDLKIYKTAFAPAKP